MYQRSSYQVSRLLNLLGCFVLVLSCFSNFRLSSAAFVDSEFSSTSKTSPDMKKVHVALFRVP